MADKDTGEKRLKETVLHARRFLEVFPEDLATTEGSWIATWLICAQAQSPEVPLEELCRDLLKPSIDAGALLNFTYTNDFHHRLEEKK